MFNFRISECFLRRKRRLYRYYVENSINQEVLEKWDIMVRKLYDRIAAVTRETGDQNGMKR